MSHYLDGSVGRRDRQVGGSPSVRSDACPCCVSKAHFLHTPTMNMPQVTPLSFNVQRIPYPIPPAGADPATYRSEEEPPPLGITFPFAPDIVLLDHPVKVG